MGSFDLQSWVIAPSAAHVALVVAGILIALWLVMCALRVFAAPWVGIGEDVETFERFTAFVRIAWLPLAVAVIISVLLLRALPDADCNETGAKCHAENTRDERKHASGEKPDDELAAAVQSLSRSIGHLGKQPDATDTKSLHDIADRLGALEATMTQVIARLPSDQSELDKAVSQLAAEVGSLVEAVRAEATGSDKIAGAIGKFADLPAWQAISEHLAVLDTELADARNALPGHAGPEMDGLGARLDRLIAAVEAIAAKLQPQAPDTAAEGCKLQAPVVRNVNASPDELRLMKEARSRGLVGNRLYRTSGLQLLIYEPGDIKPSQQSMNRLAEAVQDAQARNQVLLVRVKSDRSSDGADAAAVATGRADYIAQYIAKHGAVPVLGFVASTPPGTEREPYRRSATIQLLEPCT